MMHRFALAFLLLWLPGEPAQAIPPLRTETLAGQPVVLPDGHACVLVIGFSQSSGSAVTLWGKQFFAASPPVEHYEMAVLAAVPRVLRGMVGGRIKASMPDLARTHFLFLFDHETEWRALAHYSAPDDAYVLLLDGSGNVRWQTHGVPTDASRAELATQAKRLATQ